MYFENDRMVVLTPNKSLKHMTQNNRVEPFCITDIKRMTNYCTLNATQEREILRLVKIAKTILRWFIDEHLEAGIHIKVCKPYNCRAT